MRHFWTFSIFLLLSWACSSKQSSPIEIKIDLTLESDLKDGRLLLIFSPDSTKEPRFGISDNVGTNQVFGMDFENYKPGNPIEFDITSFGYPKEKLYLASGLFSTRRRWISKTHMG